MPIVEPQLIHSELFHSIGISAFFSERQGGVSEPPFDSLNFGQDTGDHEHSVSTNMKLLIAHTGLTTPPHQALQKHGIDHIICSGRGQIHKTAADILISSEKECPIAVHTADCLPILLADPEKHIIAAVHAGWRGTAQQVVAYAIKIMGQQGADSKHIHASLGPCIGPCCFEIDESCANQLAGSTTNARNAIIRKAKPHADLIAMNIMQLQEAGVSAQHIESDHTCTCCHPDRFYSHRRDHDRAGHHLAVVVLPDDI